MQNLMPIPVFKNNMPLNVVAPDVECLQIMMVNVYFVGHTEGDDTRWFLIDAGMGKCTGRIKKTAAYLFGEHRPPEAILLTHGHADHVGALADLATEWDVPVYAHPMELPYLTGRSSYPPPDPTVGGGLLAFISSAFPKDPIDIADRVRPFPEDGTIPGLPGWKVIHTPGHTPGHVSFFREQDRVLIAGDAFVTVQQESLRKVLRQEQELHGPPAYFTSHWPMAHESVKKLAELRPLSAGCGHGKPMHGEMLQHQLETLAIHFREIAVPAHGRYVYQPAEFDSNGVVSIPPPASDTTGIRLAKIGMAAGLGVLLGYWGKKLWPS